MAAPSTQSPVVAGFSGTAKGGPTPIIGARVVMYATTSNGYGATATVLAEADQQGASAHQDTDTNGVFNFTNNFTCPAGQFAYVVIYGGNTGANANNPNSVLMAPVGSCSAMYTGTTYNGSLLVVNELTTIASAYALSNFMTVAGNAVNGYTVNIGSSSTNNAASGCVANAYYTGCTTTATAGLKHAFANAMALVNTSGQVNTNTATGAIIPAQFINTLGNILENCVNSTGGGTSATTGLPTTTTTASGTSHDGTICGKLFAFSSYTLNGSSSGTLVAPGNTLDVMKNLAKRPTGSASLFNSTCSSNSASGGTNTAVSCIFGLGTANSYYTNPNYLMTAPSDWMLAISYPLGSFSTATNATSCTAVPATNGMAYGFMIATDIQDNLVILNSDTGSQVCTNLIMIANDGTTLGASAYDNTTPVATWLSLDSFGHAIVPVHSTATTTGGIRIYAAGTADSTLPLLTTITTSSTPALPAASGPWYTAVDSHDRIYVGAHNLTNDLGFLTVSGTESHSSPSYTATSQYLTSTTTYYTSTMNMLSIDINNNVFTTNASSTANTYMVLGTTTGAASSGAHSGTLTANTSSTSSGNATFPDTSGNVWNVAPPSGYSAVAGSPSPTDVIYEQTYNTTTPSVAVTSAATATVTPGTYKMLNSFGMDGSNVIWWADQSGSTVNSAAYPGWLHGYDTVNAFDTGAYRGCKFPSTTATACGDAAGSTSGIPFVVWQERGMAIDSAGSLWLCAGTTGQINEVIGLATPTWPLFIHNGISNKP
jgi:hypothetical protein